MLNKFSSHLLKNFISVIIIIVLIFLFLHILPDPETIKESLEAIKGANPFWVTFGLIAFFISVPFNALQLNVVSFKKLKFWLSFKVQMALQFVAKFFPSSIGGFILNSFYLLRMGHTPAQSTSVITMKAITSSVSFIGITILAIIFGVKYLQEMANQIQHQSHNINSEKIIVIIGIITISVISCIWILIKLDATRRFLDKTVVHFWNQLKSYKNRPKDFAWALIHATGATVFGMLTLYASAKAIGLDVNFTQTFLIYTLGSTFGAIIPIPGGMGAAAAGFYSGFILLGFPSAESIAAVTLYRIISFWIPTIPGIAFFINLRKDLLKNFSFSSDFVKKNKTKKA